MVGEVGLVGYNIWSSFEVEGSAGTEALADSCGFLCRRIDAFEVTDSGDNICFREEFGVAEIPAGASS